jgi:hypothetical protein
MIRSIIITSRRAMESGYLTETLLCDRDKPARSGASPAKGCVIPQIGTSGTLRSVSLSSTRGDARSRTRRSSVAPGRSPVAPPPLRGSCGLELCFGKTSIAALKSASVPTPPVRHSETPALRCPIGRHSRGFAGSSPPRPGDLNRPLALSTLARTARRRSSSLIRPAQHARSAFRSR